MADNDTTQDTAPEVKDAPVADSSAVEVPQTNPNAVVSQEGALVGDDAVAAGTEESSFQVTVDTAEAVAQVSPPRAPDSDKVAVHEVYVVTDRAILDPSSPLAVQIPDAGRGSLVLPIHALANGTVDEQIAAQIAARDSE